MDFKAYYLSLSTDERKRFADKVGTSPGYCHQIAYGAKRIELGLADAIVAASGKVKLAELPLTQRAIHQDKVRKSCKKCKCSHAA